MPEGCQQTETCSTSHTITSLDSVADTRRVPTPQNELATCKTEKHDAEFYRCTIFNSRQLPANGREEKHILKIKRQREKIEKLLDKFEQQKSCIRELEEHIGDLQALVTDKSARIALLQGALNEAQTQVKNLQGYVGKLKKEYVGLPVYVVDSPGIVCAPHQASVFSVLKSTGGNHIWQEEYPQWEIHNSPRCQRYNSQQWQRKNSVHQSGIRSQESQKSGTIQHRIQKSEMTSEWTLELHHLREHNKLLVRKVTELEESVQTGLCRLKDFQGVSCQKCIRRETMGNQSSQRENWRKEDTLGRKNRELVMKGEQDKQTIQNLEMQLRKQRETNAYQRSKWEKDLLCYNDSLDQNVKLRKENIKLVRELQDNRHRESRLKQVASQQNKEIDRMERVFKSLQGKKQPAKDM